MGTYGDMIVDGLVGGSMQLLPTGYGMTGYPNYGGFGGGAFVFNFSNVTAAGEVLWIDADQNSATGYQGYDYHVIYKAGAAPVLYSGAQGATFVATLGDYAQRANTGGVAGVFIQEFALPSSLIGSTSAIFTSYGLSHVIAAPVAPGAVYGSKTLDGSLSDWNALERLDFPAAARINNLEVWGKVTGNALVFALKVSDTIPYTIGSETRIWLNTDLNNMTGAAVPLWNISGSPTVGLGVEYNIRFDQAGHPILDEGAARTPKGGAGYYGDIEHGILDYAISADGKTMEVAVPFALIGGAQSAYVHMEVPGVGQGPYPQFAGRGYYIAVDSPPPTERPPIILPPPPPPPVPPPPPPVNYPPTITHAGGAGQATVSVAENTTAVAVITATDSNAGQTLTWTLVGGGDKDLFVINSATGALSFKNAPDFEASADFNHDNVYDVIVQVTDGAGGASGQILKVAVTDVAELPPLPPPPPPPPPPNTAPTIRSNGAGTNASIALAENTLLAATVSATDPDAGQTLSHAITGGADKDLFVLNASTGALSFKVAPDYEAPGDAGGNNVYDVVVSVSDGAGGTDTQTLAITVTDAAGATVTGNSRDNVLSGGGENDTIYGRDGNDTLNGLGGADLLKGEDGADTLNGGAGADTLDGGVGRDVLDGGDGADRLIGGEGRDLMTGGAGADDFVLRSTSDSGTTSSARDVIQDFDIVLDRIDLSGIDANTRTSGDQAFTLLAQGASITAAGQLAWNYQTINGVVHTIIQGNVNSDRAADFVIDLVGQHALTASDFIL